MRFKIPEKILFAIKLTVVFAAYFFTAKFGLSFSPVSGFATLVWPPTGIAIAAVLLSGFRVWPAVFLAAFLVNKFTGAPLAVAAGIGAGNTLEAVAGAYLLKRLGFRNGFYRIADVLNFSLFGAFLSSAISATIGVTSIFLGGIVSSASYFATWFAWWVGDMLGALVVAPLILFWFSRPRLRISAWRFWEFLILFVVWFAIAFGVFFATSHENFVFIYLVFLPLIWAATRFSVGGAIGFIFITSIAATWATVSGSGPFTMKSLSYNLSDLQIFMAVISVASYVIAAAIEERSSLIGQIRVGADELKRRISELEETKKTMLDILEGSRVKRNSSESSS